MFGEGPKNLTTAAKPLHRCRILLGAVPPREATAAQHRSCGLSSVPDLSPRAGGALGCGPWQGQQKPGGYPGTLWEFNIAMENHTV